MCELQHHSGATTLSSATRQQHAGAAEAHAQQMEGNKRLVAKIRQRLFARGLQCMCVAVHVTVCVAVCAAVYVAVCVARNAW